MSEENTFVEPLIKISQEIVDLIDDCVQKEEEYLAKMASGGTQSEPDSSSTGNDGSQTTPSNPSHRSNAPFEEHSSSSREMGTDINHFAGDVDWEALKSTNTNWVYCKASGGYSNTGYNYQDSKFAEYWPQLKQASLARGAYCFFDLNTDGDVQAQFFLQTLKAAGGLESDDLPPCLDIEWTTNPPNLPFPTDTTWQNEALKWLKDVEQKTGRIPVIYTGLSMAQNHFDSRFNRYPLWVARYPSGNAITPTENPYPSYEPTQLGPWKDWTIWQYSQTGTLAGIGSGQDLDILKGSVTEFVQATTVGENSLGTTNHTETDHQANLPQPHASPNLTEQKSPLETVGGVQVYKTLPSNAVIYQSGLNVDADGSPFAYHPEPDSDKGLDYLANAGHSGNWWGIATDNGQSSGQPVVQQANDPAPGYYVSTTALEDSNYNSSDPRAYVNASEIPFIVLPLGHDYFGGGMGDLGAVVNLNNGKVAYVIAADAGPEDKLGEGSVALAEALGVNSSPKNGGVSSGIAYCFFPGSGNGRPQTLDAINQKASALFTQFGGAEQLKGLLAN